mgnify:CR=1 FL=1
MSYVCPSSPNYPKPMLHDDFWNTYYDYAALITPFIGTSKSFVLCHWFQEWGIPINNPGFQTSTENKKTIGKCGSFPVFETLQDGVLAYKELMVRRYCGGDTAYTNIFGDKNNVTEAFYFGFPGGKTATNVQNDDGHTVNVTSEAFSGFLADRSILSGTYAANEMIGSSYWNAGHYMRGADSYPGRRLNLILNQSGWAQKEQALIS